MSFDPIRKSIFALIFVLSAATVTAQTNLLNNPGFEQSSAGRPSAWSIDNPTAMGTANLTPAGKKSGNYALSLTWQPTRPALVQLGAGQSMASGALLGRTLYVSGWLSASSQATAVLTALAYRRDGRTYFIQLRQGATQPPVQVKDKLVIPNDPEVLFVVVLCQIEGTGTAYFDDLSVTLTQPAGWTEPAGGGGGGVPQGLSAQVTVNAAQTVRMAPAGLYGQNLEWVWGGHGAWDLVNKRPSPTMTALTQDLGSRLLRFPGGLLADYYDWRKAVGPLSSRPVMDTMPGSDPQVAFFGTDEALQFASAVGGELLITVNAGTGTAQMAADWVRYANRNGLKVRYWEIGNELYGVGGPMFDPITLTPQRYAQKVMEFSRAMKAADPRIKVGAIACESFLTMGCLTYPSWTETVLSMAGNDIDYLAVHNAYAPGVGNDTTSRTGDVYAAMLAAPQAIRRSLAALEQKVAVYAPARAGQIKIAVTEWGPYFSTTGASRFVEHNKTMASAVYAASVLKVFLESPGTEMANAFKLVDGVFTGWIGKRNGEYVPKAPYYVLRMFAKNFTGPIVASSTVSPAFSAISMGNVPAAAGVPYVEAIAGKSVDGRTLSVALWNKHLTSAISVECLVSNFNAAATASTWSLTGTAADSHTGTQPIPGLYVVPQASMEGNTAFHAGTTSTVTMPTGTATVSAGKVNVTIPPASVLLLTIPSR